MRQSVSFTRSGPSYFSDLSRCQFPLALFHSLALTHLFSSAPFPPRMMIRATGPASAPKVLVTRTPSTGQPPFASSRFRAHNKPTTLHPQCISCQVFLSLSSFPTESLPHRRARRLFMTPPSTQSSCPCCKVYDPPSSAHSRSALTHILNNLHHTSTPLTPRLQRLHHSLRPDGLWKDTHDRGRQR